MKMRGNTQVHFLISLVTMRGLIHCSNRRIAVLTQKQSKPLTGIIQFAFSSVVVITLLLSTASASASHNSFKFPFRAGETWKVQRGYNYGGHTGYQRYSLDLVRTDEQGTAGSDVLAPASGKVVWRQTSGTKCISIKISGHNTLFTMLCHINGLGNFSVGASIKQGQKLGTVAPAEEANAYLPHIHITFYSVADGTDNNVADRRGRPFSTEFGSSLDGANFYRHDGISNQFKGVRGLCSSQNKPQLSLYVVTSDTNGTQKYTFRRSDPIVFGVGWGNNSSSEIVSSQIWRVFGPSDFSWYVFTGDRSSSSYTSGYWEVATEIPSSSPVGQNAYFTFRVKATYNGITSCRVNLYRVVP